MNKSKLYDAMTSKNISKLEMANALGISRTAFWRKCNGVSEFTLSEIQKMVRMLNLSSTNGIFFD